METKIQHAIKEECFVVFTYHLSVEEVGGERLHPYDYAYITRGGHWLVSVVHFTHCGGDNLKGIVCRCALNCSGYCRFDKRDFWDFFHLRRFDKTWVATEVISKMERKENGEDWRRLPTSELLRAGEMLGWPRQPDWVYYEVEHKKRRFF